MESLTRGDLEPLEPVPALRERVSGQLESLIIGGSLPPGARLVETELAQTLGVSRGPIREALQVLARDGWVDLRPRQGAFVHVPTEAEIRDFFDLRRLLEAESARLAATRITREGTARLREALQRGLDLLAEGRDPTGRPPTLHAVIADIAGNGILSEILLLLSKRSRWYLSPFDLDARKREWREHSEIVEAIVAGDPDAASASMIRHVDGAAALYGGPRGDGQQPGA